MPKRTNDFQTLIAFIEKELASLGVTVTESAELPEAADSSDREVDVLIEAKVNNHPIRIAIECRDHKQPQDVTWIDALVGKYRDLKINSVVAVSRSGFTPSALGKAERVGIRAITFEQVFETNWPNEFFKLNLRAYQWRIRLKAVNIEYHSDETLTTNEDELRQCKVVSPEGEIDGTCDEIVRGLYDHTVGNMVEKFINENAFRLVDNNEEADLDVIMEYNGGDRRIEDMNGRMYQMVSIRYTVGCHISVLDGNNEYFGYNNTQITVGSIDFDDINQTLTVTAVQFPKEPMNEIKVADVRFLPKKPD